MSRSPVPKSLARRFLPTSANVSPTPISPPTPIAAFRKPSPDLPMSRRSSAVTTSRTFIAPSTRVCTEYRPTIKPRGRLLGEHAKALERLGEHPRRLDLWCHLWPLRRAEPRDEEGRPDERQRRSLRRPCRCRSRRAADRRAPARRTRPRSRCPTRRRSRPSAPRASARGSAGAPAAPGRRRATRRRRTSRPRR